MVGLSYYFSSSDLAKRNPQNLFSTIARDLFDLDPQYQSTLWGVVKGSRTLRKSTSPVEQMESILEPSKHVDSIGPLVIVIDALDESGDQKGRRSLLQAIKQMIGNTLLTNLRFLITARLESDILDAIKSSLRLVHRQMGDIDEKTVDRDIERFIRHSLDRHRELEASWPEGEWCQLLGSHSQRLFQWATTACEFIHTLGIDPCDQLNLLLRDDASSSVEPLHNFTELY